MRRAVPNSGKFGAFDWLWTWIGRRGDERAAADMKLVLGLGNPSLKYERTRHNVGFEVIETIATKHSLPAPREKFRSLIREMSLGDQRVLLLKPLTFMNLSGAAALAARDFFHVDNEDILIVCDDLNLPVSRLRIRPDGTAGGQKGLADIIKRLGTEQIPRLRIGIGAPPENWDAADYVLGRFQKDEKPEMDEAVARAADAVHDWVRQGTEYCMNQYNAPTKP